jgi:hypothetical protein
MKSTITKPEFSQPVGDTGEKSGLKTSSGRHLAKQLDGAAILTCLKSLHSAGSKSSDCTQKLA